MPENELKWRNHYMHTIPLIATATRESADALIALCKADLESTSPCNKLTKLRAPGKPKQLFILSIPVLKAWASLALFCFFFRILEYLLCFLKQFFCFFSKHFRFSPSSSRLSKFILWLKVSCNLFCREQWVRLEMFLFCRKKVIIWVKSKHQLWIMILRDWLQRT